MKTCKDCLHYEVCAEVMKQQLYIKEVLCGRKNPVCPQFADRSEWVRLPCKIGSIVYQLDNIVDFDFCSGCESFYKGGMGDLSCCEKTRYGFRHCEKELNLRKE